MQLQAALLHSGMHDGVQRGQRHVVAHDLAAQRGAIERAVGRQHVRAESSRNRREDRAPGRLRFANERVGVDDRGSPFAEEVDDGRFAGGDVAGESDVEHR